ncbi:MAG: hypothetical protein JXB34_00300 [Bacteroidales bacterium]|nr:hypothetical protein [Bacteroidales bacterium]
MHDTAFVGNVNINTVRENYSQYVEKLKGEQPRMYSALKLIVPQLNEDTGLTFYFQNNSLLDEYKLRVKPSLLSHLRTALNNEMLEISEVVADAEHIEKPRLFSDNEKLQHMIEKNPALQKLKTRFNLDFD